MATRHILGVDLHYIKPSIVVLLDRDLLKIVFSEVYTTSLKEPIARVRRYLVEYEPAVMFYDASQSGLMSDQEVGGWPVTVNTRTRTELLAQVEAAVEERRLALPFDGGWSAVPQDERLAFGLAWYGIQFNPYPINWL